MTPEKVKKLNKLTKHLFNEITADDFLRQEGKSFYIGKNLVPQETVKEFAAAARVILDTRLWKQMSRDIKYECNKRLFTESVTVDDMFFPKGALWMLDVIERKMEKLSRLE
jgi:hypothetical protein